MAETKQALTAEELDCVVGGRYGGWENVADMPPTPPGMKIYQIQQGDWLSKIALKCGNGVTVSDLMRYNQGNGCGGFDDENQIRTGYYMFVPAGANLPETPRC